eukprot:scaffold4779_cov133-Skeletonema_dohrnii-CCMP3373.AAC.2
MSLNKSFASFTLSNAVLGNVNESSLIMTTFLPILVEFLRLRARFLRHHLPFIEKKRSISARTTAIHHVPRHSDLAGARSEINLC